MKITIKKKNQEEIYEIPDWLVNQKQFYTLQPAVMEEIVIDYVRESEKAICVIGDKLIGEVWLPKSQLKEYKYYPSTSICKSLIYNEVEYGNKITDEKILNVVSPENIRKFGKEAILSEMWKEIEKIKEEKN